MSCASSDAARPTPAYAGTLELLVAALDVLLGEELADEAEAASDLWGLGEEGDTAAVTMFSTEKDEYWGGAAVWWWSCSLFPVTACGASEWLTFCFLLG